MTSQTRQKARKSISLKTIETEINIDLVTAIEGGNKAQNICFGTTRTEYIMAMRILLPATQLNCTENDFQVPSKRFG